MITVHIDNLKEIQAEMGAIGSDQLPYATALALTKTAQAGQAKVRSDVLPQHFTLRRAAWLKQNIRVEPATKTNLVSTVRDTYLAMVLQEAGGTKIPFGQFIAVPLKGARPSITSLIAPENLPAAVIANGGFINGNILYAVTLQAGRRGALKRGIKGISRAASWSRQIIPMYALVPRAYVPARYGFEPAVVQVVQNTFPDNFHEAFQKAVRTAR